MREPISATDLDQLIARTTGAGVSVTVVDSPPVLIAMKTFRPGEVFPNHFHEHHDEFFAGITGEVVVWQNRQNRLLLRAGETALCARGSHHMLVNESTEDATVLYVKTPQVPDDTSWVGWAPSGTP